MRFLLDENIHAGLTAFLASLGHDATRVPSGIRNGEVLALAVREDRILVTHDKDFQDESRYPAAATPGIICLRVHPPVLERLTRALADRLRASPPESLRGRTTVVTG